MFFEKKIVFKILADYRYRFDVLSEIHTDVFLSVKQKLGNSNEKIQNRIILGMHTAVGVHFLQNALKKVRKKWLETLIMNCIKRSRIFSTHNEQVYQRCQKKLPTIFW